MSDDRTDWAHEVVRQLADMPRDARRALSLRYFACLDRRAVAERTRSAPSAVRTATARGLLDLGRRLESAAGASD